MKKLYLKILNYLVEKDQENREYIKITSLHQFYDYLSYKFIKHLYKKLQKNSWFEFLIVNQEKIWLLVNHCDKYTKLQHKYIKFFIECDINSKYIAILTDRVNINISQFQFYGTQWVEYEKTLMIYPIDGINTLELMPLDLAKINKIRNTMNLNDLETDLGKISDSLNLYQTFKIYNDILNIKFKKNIRRIRDISDYRYFQK